MSTNLSGAFSGWGSSWASKVALRTSAHKQAVFALAKDGADGKISALQHAVCGGDHLALGVHKPDPGKGGHGVLQPVDGGGYLVHVAADQAYDVAQGVHFLDPEPHGLVECPGQRLHTVGQ